MYSFVFKGHHNNGTQQEKSDCKGSLELVLEHIVQGRLNRLPHAFMSVPGMSDAVVREVLNVVKKECKKLTSLKFKSVLRKNRAALFRIATI